MAAPIMPNFLATSLPHWLGRSRHRLTALDSAVLVGEAALEFSDREQEVVFDFLAGCWEVALQ
jgi:hypothetical protein